MQQPKISVIIPVYNVEDYLVRCVKSVTGQTYTNLEIFLVDDGSKDRSGQMCDDLAKEDGRIRVIHKENGGLSDARNVAIDVCTGDLLTFVDSDDFLTPDCIEHLYRVKEEFDAQISCCLFRNVKPEEALNPDESRGPETVCWPRVQALEQMLRAYEVCCSAWAKLYDRELFADIRYPFGKICEDGGTTYKLFALAERVALVRKVGYGYTIRSGSIMQSRFSAPMMAQLEFGKEQKAFLDARFPELEMATTDRLVSICFHLLFEIGNIDGFESEKEELKNTIKMNRAKLLKDRSTSPKTRIACFISYFGFDLTKALFLLSGVKLKLVK